MFTVKVKNITDVDVFEVFPVYGEVRVPAGETADIPHDVADAWLNPLRNEVKIEKVEMVPVEEKTPPKKAAGKKETPADDDILI